MVGGRHIECLGTPGMYIHGMLSIKIIGRMESYSSKIVLFKTSLYKDLLRISTNKNGDGYTIFSTRV